jgi:hypothetical protein
MEDIAKIVARANEDILHVLARTQAVAPREVAARLSDILEKLGAPPLAMPSDVMTQAGAAVTAGVSRQAVHRMVAEGRVKGYPNLDRADRAPMVSLAEVRAAIGARTHEKGAASEVDEAIGHGTPAAHPLKPHPANADTTSGGSTLPVDPTGPVPPPDGEIPDPPWLNEEAVRYDLIHYSAAASGEAFLDMPQSDQEALIEANMRALRETWRKWSPEQRAEAWAAYARERQEHPPRQG